MHSACLLARFLAELDQDENPQKLLEECSGEVSLEACAAVMTARGLDARVVKVGTRDLRALAVPTLVELPGRRIAVLTRARGRQVRLELDPAGRTVQVASKRAAIGRAIDRSVGSTGMLAAARSGSVRTLLVDLWRGEGQVRRAVFSLLLYAALAAVAALLTPLLVSAGMDAATSHDTPATLSFVVMAAILLGSHRAWFLWLRNGAARYLQARVGVRLRTALVERFLRVPLLEAERLAGGQGWQILTISEHLASEIIGFATTALSAALGVASLLVVFVEMPAAALALIAVVGLVLAINGMLAPRVVRLRVAGDEAARRQHAELLDLIRGAVASQVAAAETNGVRRWLGRLIEEGEVSFRSFWAERRLYAVTEAVERLALAGLLVWCGLRCIDGALTRPSAVAVMQGGGMFLWSGMTLAHALIDAAGLRACVRRIDDVLGRGSTPVSGAPAASRPRRDFAPPVIELRGVWFRYGEHRPWVIEDLSLRIEAGQKLLLRWSSGGGKTTLLRIMAGLVPPTHGTVTVAGLDPTQARALVTYLPQNTFLFAGSILDNLTVLSGGQPPDRLETAARATGLDEMLHRWPMGVHTVVAHAGANLSGGERQLVAFTAALASDRPILLMDESLANADRLIQARLTGSDLFAGKTVIRVVHHETVGETAGAASPAASSKGSGWAALAVGLSLMLSGMPAGSPRYAHAAPASSSSSPTDAARVEPEDARAYPKISLAEALRQALGRNVAAIVAGREVARADALVVEARAAALPSAFLTGSVQVSNADREIAQEVIAARVQRGAAATVSIPLLAPRAWTGWSESSTGLATARSDRAEVERALAAAVARAYLAVTSWKRRVEVGARAVANDRSHREHAHARAVAGAGNRLDEVRAAQQLAADEAALSVLYGSLARAREALSVLVCADGPLDTVEETAIPGGDLGGMDAEASRADVRAAWQRFVGAEQRRRNSWADFMPILGGQAQVFYQDPATVALPRAGWQALVILSIPAFEGGLRIGQRRERDALADEARAQYEAVLRQARSDLRAAVEGIRRSEEAARAARAAFQLARQGLELATGAYRSGALTNIEVIDAERQARDLDAAAALAEDAVRQARLDLLLAAGQFP